MKSTDMKYMLSATKYDILEFIYNRLHEVGWKTSFNYLVHKPKLFYDKPLAIADGSKYEFNKYLDYCHLLSKNYTEKDEAHRYKDKNGISIYFSVVLYWLLVSFGVVNEKNLRFCQGYFVYKIKNELAPRTRYRAGLHSWLSYEGSVIDVTIWQQNGSFENTGHDTELILGEIPPGLDLFGFVESKSLAKEYARRFARESGMTFFEWLNYHKEQANLLDSACKLNHSA